jgi:DNA-binding response OmpR family regulator
MAITPGALLQSGHRVKWRHFAVQSPLPSLDQPSYPDEHLYVDMRQQLVKLCGQTLTLTRKEYCLLALLVMHAGEVVPRAIMLTELGRSLPETRIRALDVHISWLRRD